MRLVLTAFAVFIKRGLYAVLCAALCLLAIASVVMLALPEREIPPVRLAIVNEDADSLMLSVISSLVESELEGMLTAELYPSEQAAADCAAVLTLPEGFFESIMTGENLPPRLTVRVSSPIEGAWVSCLAQSAARLISGAQETVGAVHAAMLADGLPAAERERSLMLLNASLLNGYLSRKGRFESVFLSSTGGVTLPQYYLASGASFMLFLTALLFFAPIRELKGFAFLSRKRGACFAAALTGCLLLSYCLIAAALLLAGGGLSSLFSGSALLSALLLCGVMLLFPSVVPDAAGCVASSAGFCLLQAVLGGGLLPEALLPQPLLSLCGFWPLSLLRRLLADAAFGCGFLDLAAALLWCMALLLCCAAVWLKGRDEA